MSSLRPVFFALSLLGGAVPAFVSVGSAQAAPAAAAGPKATLQRLNGSVDKYLRMKTEPNSAEEKRVKDEVKRLASELLDYGELCKRALGEHWAKMTEKQRTEFVETLQELIERNYIKQLRTNLDYQVLYKDEQIEGSEARVSTTIRIATKGKSTEATIDYRMLKHDEAAGPRWLVYDVVTDELSLVRNYRSQFQRIISGQGYDGLLTKMKGKLAEERASEAKESGGAAKGAETAPEKAPGKAPGNAPGNGTNKAAAPAKKTAKRAPAAGGAGRAPSQRDRRPRRSAP